MRSSFFIFTIIILAGCQSKQHNTQEQEDSIIIVPNDKKPQAATQADSTLKETLHVPDSSDGSFEKLIEKITFSPTIKEDKSFLPIKKASCDTIRMNDSVAPFQ